MFKALPAHLWSAKPAFESVQRAARLLIRNLFDV